MRGRSVALFAAILSAAMFLAPALCEPADALSDDDYKVTIPMWHGPGTLTDITIGNGHSRDIVVYVENFTDHYLDVTFEGDTYSDFVRGSRIANATLPPAKGEASMIEEVFVISVDEYAPARTHVDFDLVITVTDIYDETSERVVVMFEVNVVNEFDLTSSYNKFFGIIPNTLPRPFDTSMTPFLVTLAAFLGIALLAAMAMMPLFRRYTYLGTKYEGWRLMWPLGLATVSVSLLIFTYIGPWILGYDLMTTGTVERICTAILVAMLFVAVWKAYTAVVSGVLRKIDTDDEYKQNALGPVFNSFGMIILWGVGAAVILTVLGVDVVSVLVSSSLVTLGVSIGAKSVLSQIFNGINVAMSKRFKVGDMVTVGDGTYIVKDVGLIYTELWGPQRDRVVSVPNSTMAETPITDNQGPTGTFLVSLAFTVPYGTDLPGLEAKVLEFARSMDDVVLDEGREPEFSLLEFGESWIKVELRMRMKRRITAFELKGRLYRMLRENGIETPRDRVEITIIDRESTGSMETDWRARE